MTPKKRAPRLATAAALEKVRLSSANDRADNLSDRVRQDQTRLMPLAGPIHTDGRKLPTEPALNGTVRPTDSDRSDVPSQTAIVRPFDTDSDSDLNRGQSLDRTRAVESYPQTSKSDLTKVSGLRRESSAAYGRVVTHLNEEWRVIECRDGIQWIVQRWVGNRWRNETYHRQREFLLIRARQLSSDSRVLTQIEALPARPDAK